MRTVLKVVHALVYMACLACHGMYGTNTYWAATWWLLHSTVRGSWDHVTGLSFNIACKLQHCL